MGRPSAGSAQWATRHGCRLAAHGHGWPIAAGPRSRTGARVCRAQARHRTKGARAFGYLALFQVTRRKGETNRSRNRSNGYVHHQEFHRQSGRHREQALLLQHGLTIRPFHRHPIPLRQPFRLRMQRVPQLPRPRKLRTILRAQFFRVITTQTPLPQRRGRFGSRFIKWISHQQILMSETAKGLKRLNAQALRVSTRIG
jgi:hypothetical protein